MLGEVLARWCRLAAIVADRYRETDLRQCHVPEVSIQSVRCVFSSTPLPHFVMPGLVPGISFNQLRRRMAGRMDGRNESGHDVVGIRCQRIGIWETAR